MESGVKIRLAVPEDADAIASLLLTAFAETKPHYTADAFAATTPGSDTIRERFLEGPIWVALKDGKVAGTVSVVPEGERLYIRSMAVLPGMQGGGIGRKLLEIVEGHAVEGGFARMFLYTTNFLIDAHRLYKRNGFELAAISGPEEFFGTPGIVMEKKLI